jgi:DNA polymerase delta subunit 1
MEKMMCLYNYAEMARVTGVPIKFLFTRGQQIKVTSQLYRKAYEVDMLIPNEKRNTESEGKYEGATVIEPEIGFYDDPIATLDFASLYPSIMMAHNLCYSTLIPRQEIHKHNKDDYVQSPNGDYFIKSEKCEGLLPKILQELLGARKQAKRELAEATDPFLKAVLNGRQLALKVSANSVYGFTGAQTGQLPCLAISSSVTAYGRQMIDLTKKLVEEKYKIVNGYEFDAHVIYGDTDSVMVKFGGKDIANSMRLGQEAANEISKTFIKPIKLEFEKVYCPYLLMAKKKYAGLLYTNPEKYDKIDAKGIETVRRDCCGIVREVMSEILDKILIENNIQGAVALVKGVVSDLLQNRIDMSQLIITKELGKKTQGQEEEEQKANKKNGTKAKTDTKNSYQSKMPHVMLADRMRKRDPATAPKIGDRVQYVIVKGSKNAKIYERSEDPLYVLENNIELDHSYYLENQLKKPLIRIFEAILANPEKELFAGDHTRIIYKPKTQQTKGGLGGFLKVTKT